MSTPIRISIVEDEPDTRSSLISLLTAGGLQCVSSYGSAEDALQHLPSDAPDLVLVDINLPGMSGIECVRRLKGARPGMLVLMLTTYEDADLIFNSLRAGASGYLLKNTPPSELIEAVRELHAGGAPMSMQIARKVVDHFHQFSRPQSEVEQLSKREHEVLTLLARGCFYKEIADILGLSMGSVRTYVQRIYEKLHVQSRTEATVKFLARQ